MSRDTRARKNLVTREIRITSDKDGNFKVESSNAFMRPWDYVWRNVFKKITPVWRILIWYMAFSLIGGALLWWPATHVEGAQTITFIDALFMSSSAFSDTGLTTMTIVDQFNIWGQLIIFFEILIGGIGWFTIKIFLLSFFIRKGMSWRNKRWLAQESGADMKTAEGIAKTAGIVTLSSILIFGSIFGIMFHTISPLSQYVDASTYDPTHSWGQAMWTGYFMAGSAINNAGMDIIGGNSLMAYYHSYSLQFMMMFLFVLGGMGFGIIYDFNNYLLNKWKGQKFRFSLLTKASVVTYFTVSFIGLSLAYTFEWVAYHQEALSSFFGMKYDPNSAFALDYGTTTDRLVALAFNTMSTRNAGFNTIDLNTLTDATTNTFAFMMFIGSGPGSTAGGIRTTTLFVLLVAIWQFMRGKSETSAFNRKIPSETVRKSFVLATSAAVLVMASSLAIQVIEIGNDQQVYYYLNHATGNWEYVVDSVQWQNTMFVVFSAFGTTGLSSIDISLLTSASKVILIVIMFIGQLGVLATLKIFSGRDNVSKMTRQGQMIEENIPVG